MVLADWRFKGVMVKSWAVSDIRWANNRDLALPLWMKWNKENPLPQGFWQRIWEYPYVAAAIPKNGKSIDVGGTYPFVLFPNFPMAVSVDCRDLNSLDHPYHLGKWPQGKLIQADAAHIPLDDNVFEYAFSISAIEEMPDIVAVLREMIRLARHKVVVTMDVSDSLGLSRSNIRELEHFLGVRIPNLPSDALHSMSPVLTSFHQGVLEEYRHIRVMGVTLEARDPVRSVGILIPHWESWQFLKPCLEAVQKNRNDQLHERVYVLDDSSGDGSFEKACAAFKDDPDIEFHRIERPNKHTDADVGLLLDLGLPFVKEQYVAMVDADLFSLSRDWLSFPIWLIEKYLASSVGADTCLSSAYLSKCDHMNWWQPASGYMPEAGLYDNEWFTCTNNLYRIMPSALAKVVSEQIGFTRGNTHVNSLRELIINRLLRALPLKFVDTHFPHLLNKRFPYLPGGCDNGVAANHFIDINRLGPKFNIPLTSSIGLTPHDGAFGQNICGLAFHFALSTRALSSERREVLETGKEFDYWVKKLEEAGGINDSVIQEMIAASSRFKAGDYDDSIPVSWFEEQFRYIQILLQEYRSSSWT